MKSLGGLVLGLALTVPATGAWASTIFTASLDGDQQVPVPVATSASGSATLVLNDAGTRLEINIQISGLDLDGNQTPSNTDDDVALAHIHAGPPGSNGGVVFGFIGPNSDTNGDLMIDPIAGTITSAWDADEGNGTTLTDQLATLLAGGLYINVHTTANPGGEIRGQILVPEPSALGLLALVLVSRRFMRRS